MASTVRPASDRRYQRHAPRWADAAARALGVRPATAEAMVHGKQPLHLRVAALVRAASELGDAALVGKLTAPIDDARRAAPHPNLTPGLIEDVQVADLEEDRAESAFLARPTFSNRHSWLIALRVQNTRSGDLIRALEEME